jgi:hypothetical protein
MKFCSKCGKEIHEDAVVCVNCGCSVANNLVEDMNDAPNTGFAVLGFFVPVVGLVLYLINKDKSPKKAKSAGKGALAGVITSVVLSVLYGVIIGAILGATGGGYYY